MVAGFVEPTSGEIRIGGRSVQGIPPHRRNIGVVFQSYALFPHLTVFDNIAFGLKMRRLAAVEIGEKVKRALDLVQLQGLDERYPKALSGGQQQRVALARALVIEPSVLLLDEPLSNLDANLREQMRFEIRDIQRRIGITTLFVTHDQAEAIAAADRLVVMRDGKIRQVGTASEIYETPSDIFVADFIGQANLLHGRITSMNGDKAELQTPAGAVAAHVRNKVTVGQRAVLALRPEDLVVARTQRAEFNNLPARVRRVTYLGPAISVGMQVGEMDMTITAPRNYELAGEGESVFVQWPHSAGVLLAEVNDE
jgi:putative spermidine/putrescine transport system ATP-binding protein